MKSSEIRKAFIKYFEKHGHTAVASSGLIPENDNTLLFANAGMNQFKNLFLGLEKKPYVRATSSQKCVRAGGKHNDLENVGFTARHHTFFEMLGNFSFGDYFKKDAIRFAWELLTKQLGIPKERLYVTVFESDDEAAEIWHKQEGVPRDRISRFGEKDNFWRMGDTGPCGPCTEIFYDHGPNAGCGKKTCAVGCSCDRYVEIWNLVFMQFYEDETGKQTPLPKPSVDTGAGLERVTAALQGKFNNYDTDLFAPMIEAACLISGKKYVSDPEILKKDDDARATTVALRVLADHARSTAFLIADGVIPTNEGRGYVLRRIMRRAIRYGRNLTNDIRLFPGVVESVIASMNNVYPELKAGKERVLKMTEDEVNRFIQTLDQGTNILNDAITKLKKQKLKTIDGITAFKLYDTFGFPLDLTQLIAREHHLEVDTDAFEKEMLKAKEVAKASWKGGSQSSDRGHLISIVQKQKSTEFKGYETTQVKSSVLLLSDGSKIVQSLGVGQKGFLISVATPFYAEGGGQVGDTGKIVDSLTDVDVLNCSKENDVFIHHISVNKGKVLIDQTYDFIVSNSIRRQTAANHSATHLLHAALRKTLGTHVTQAGSHVDSDRLRFDFTHGSALTLSERKKIEELVNNEIANQTEVSTKISTPKDAVEKDGALAMFGEKYGDKVRVVKMGGFSTELCGGTHVTNTSQILAFKISSEGSVSAGVRRIEAITGAKAIGFLLKNTYENTEVREAINAAPNSSLLEWVEKTKSDIKNLERQIKQSQSQNIDVDSFIKKAQTTNINGQSARLAAAIVELDDRQVLSDIVDKMKSKLGNGIVVVIGKGESSHPIIVSVSSDLIAKIKAGEVLKTITTVMGGKGGGRPDFAQGAGVDFSKASSAIDKLMPSTMNN